MRRLVSGPVGVGLIFGAIGLALTAVGIVRGEVPLRPLSIVMALVIGGGVWFLVAWAVATAARDVENDMAVESEPASAPVAPGIGNDS